MNAPSFSRTMCQSEIKIHVDRGYWVLGESENFSEEWGVGVGVTSLKLICADELVRPLTTSDQGVRGVLD